MIIDPVIVSIGPLSIRWYGMMYVIAFVLSYLIARYRLRHTYYRGFLDAEHGLSDLLFYAMLGVVLGGRFGYVFFYGFERFLDDPIWLFRVWEGGMSFHGGMLGVTAAMFLFGKRRGIKLVALTDFIAPMAAVGLFFGRIGNFIGGELYGHVTDLPWGVIFPGAGDAPRHPSQLYEAVLEGFVLASILFIFSRKMRPIMSVSSLLLIGYGIFRFLVEFVREPDSHIGYLAFGWLTMGQVLSLPMVAAGVLCFVYAYRYPKYPVIRHTK